MSLPKPPYRPTKPACLQCTVARIARERAEDDLAEVREECLDLTKRLLRAEQEIASLSALISVIGKGHA